MLSLAIRIGREDPKWARGKESSAMGKAVRSYGGASCDLGYRD